MAGWGKWSSRRELVRGILHASIGFVGWLLLQPYQADSDLITFLLSVVSGFFIILEIARLSIAKWKDTHLVARFFKWLNREIVRQFFTRDSEKFQQTTTLTSVLGLALCWLIGPRWICAAGALYFGLIDPLAKLGRYWPIRRFTKGLASGKSLGGIIFGLLGGLGGLLLVLLADTSFAPILPHSLSTVQALLIYVPGLLFASAAELFSGKWDNFFIPAGSVAIMTVTNWFLFS